MKNIISDLACGITLESNVLFLLDYFVTKKFRAVEQCD